MDDHTFPTKALAAYRRYAREQLSADPMGLDELWNYDHLACYCRPGERCHVGVLLALMQESGAAGRGARPTHSSIRT